MFKSILESYGIVILKIQVVNRLHKSYGQGSASNLPFDFS